MTNCQVCDKAHQTSSQAMSSTSSPPLQIYFDLLPCFVLYLWSRRHGCFLKAHGGCHVALHVSNHQSYCSKAFFLVIIVRCLNCSPTQLKHHILEVAMRRTQKPIHPPVHNLGFVLAWKQCCKSSSE